MTTADPRWDAIERLFDGALEQPPSAREAWLDAACGGDPGLRHEVGRMLAAHDRVDGVLDRPLVGAPSGDLATRFAAALADRYVLDREIGRGGMATVFLAHERKHARRVVLKVLKPEVAAAFGVRRFLAEVQLAARLSHPHILGLIDSGEADGLLYYVMPYVGGETLRHRLQRLGRLTAPAALVLLHDLASALAYAHGNGVVHRDVKPENVLCVGEHAFLMDFGIARLHSAVPPERLTAVGQALGTPGYMAPEQEAGLAEVDQRADVYAWGLLAVELLTGVPVPRGPAPRLPAEVPLALAALISQTLAPSPDDRPADGQGLLDALDRVAPAVAGRRRWPLAAAAGGVVIAVAAAGALLGGRDQPDVALPAPVAVAALQNETGDTSLATWGRLAADWLTQGLQEVGLTAVVPWPVALEAATRPEARDPDGGTPDPVALLRRETGAGTVVTGAYYLMGERLRFQLEVTDAATRTLLAAPAAVIVPRDSAAAALGPLRERLLGALAVRADGGRTGLPGLTERPPTYEAYLAFQRGLELHNAQEYGAAAAELRRAHELDSLFLVPLIYAAQSLWNTGDYLAADSLLADARRHRAALSEYHQRLAEHLTAMLAGDGAAGLRAILRAVDIAPGSRAAYNAALIANSLNRPADALRLLDGLDPDRGAMRGWSSYWTQRTHALHLLGRHDRELEAARALRARHPDRRVGLVLEVRALAALGRAAAIDSLIEQASPLPPNTYWSQGAALVVAGEELAAHGRRDAAPAYFARAERWFANQLVADPTNWRHRYWLGSALYDVGRFEDAAPYFASLARDLPDRLDMRGLWALIAARAGDTTEALARLGPAPAYDRGEHTAFRARIAAVSGDPGRAVDLLAEALARGVGGWPWLHASALRDLEPLSRSSRYRRLVTPAAGS